MTTLIDIATCSNPVELHVEYDVPIVPIYTRQIGQPRHATLSPSSLLCSASFSVTSTHHPFHLISVSLSLQLQLQLQLSLSPSLPPPPPTHPPPLLLLSLVTVLVLSSSCPLILSSSHSLSLSPPPPPASPVLSLLTASKQINTPPTHRSHGHSRSKQARTAPLTLSSCQVMSCHVSRQLTHPTASPRIPGHPKKPAPLHSGPPQRM